MKINPIMAVLALIFGIGGAFAAYSLSGLSADLMTNGSITLIASLLGLIGIYLFKKDYKLAVAQYVVCGIGVLIGTSMFGILGFIFYIIAAVLAYVEREENIDNLNFDDENYYTNKATIQQKYPNFPPKNSKNTVLWTIVIISAVLIILVGILGDASYNNSIQEKSNAIQIVDVTSDLKVSYGTYTGGVQGTIISTKTIENAQIKGVWYSEDGSQITETYDTSIFNDLNANQKYQLNVPYYEDENKKPAKVEIQIFENFDSTPLFTQTINFN